MVIDLDLVCCDPPSSSSSSTKIFCDQNHNRCSPCRFHRCCQSSFFNDHTYSLLKRICHKIIKGYNRRQCRETYSVFNGGNSIGLRLQHSLSDQDKGYSNETKISVNCDDRDDLKSGKESERPKGKKFFGYRNDYDDDRRKSTIEMNFRKKSYNFEETDDYVKRLKKQKDKDNKESEQNRLNKGKKNENHEEDDLKKSKNNKGREKNGDNGEISKILKKGKEDKNYEKNGEKRKKSKNISDDEKDFIKPKGKGKYNQDENESDKKSIKPKSMKHIEDDEKHEKKTKIIGEENTSKAKKTGKYNDGSESPKKEKGLGNKEDNVDSGKGLKKKGDDNESSRKAKKAKGVDDNEDGDTNSGKKSKLNETENSNKAQRGKDRKENDGSESPRKGKGDGEKYGKDYESTRSLRKGIGSGNKEGNTDRDKDGLDLKKKGDDSESSRKAKKAKGMDDNGDGDKNSMKKSKPTGDEAKKSEVIGEKDGKGNDGLRSSKKGKSIGEKSGKDNDSLRRQIKGIGSGNKEGNIESGKDDLSLKKKSGEKEFSRNIKEVKGMYDNKDEEGKKGKGEGNNGRDNSGSRSSKERKRPENKEDNVDSGNNLGLKKTSDGIESGGKSKKGKGMDDNGVDDKYSGKQNKSTVDAAKKDKDIGNKEGKSYNGSESPSKGKRLENKEDSAVSGKDVGIKKGTNLNDKEVIVKNTEDINKSKKNKPLRGNDDERSDMTKKGNKDYGDGFKYGFVKKSKNGKEKNYKPDILTIIPKGKNIDKADGAFDDNKKQFKIGGDKRRFILRNKDKHHIHPGAQLDMIATRRLGDQRRLSRRHLYAERFVQPSRCDEVRPCDVLRAQLEKRDLYRCLTSLCRTPCNPVCQRRCISCRPMVCCISCTQKGS